MPNEDHTVEYYCVKCEKPVKCELSAWVGGTAQLTHFDRDATEVRG
jgi:hypothetical protein